ncbi:hypothetical protein CTAYLR_002160 [Chrysophaeum taylorii]|uniref:Uncharacterized protein n=1 Tax=Chrysophaeum taylorii TaxID=2483200 RepID=A0AAD7UNZ5_9STRA|nr:hypothetical protein CTAYLR_002160 [Chrysophaeum taylorii]
MDSGRWLRVFGVHTGHVGSRSLGKGACILADEISFVFEYDQIYNDSSYPWDSNGMNMWYADSKRGSAMHLLETTILPNYLLLSKPNQHLIVDFGHNLNLGFLRPLAAVLGDRVAFVRVVRHRYDTCRSFMSEGKVPCGKGMWTLCPTKHPHIALPPPRGVWNGLTPWQKVMWFIDEVEARWQRLLADFPDIDRLLVHWCDGLDFERARFAVFDFFGQRAAAAVGSERKINVVAKKCKQGKHTDPSLKSLLSDAELGVQDADYQALMAYDNHTLSFTLRNVLRPFDCGYQK